MLSSKKTLVSNGDTVDGQQKGCPEVVIDIPDQPRGEVEADPGQSSGWCLPIILIMGVVILLCCLSAGKDQLDPDRKSDSQTRGQSLSKSPKSHESSHESPQDKSSSDPAPSLTMWGRVKKVLKHPVTWISGLCLVGAGGYSAYKWDQDAAMAQSADINTKYAAVGIVTTICAAVLGYMYFWRQKSFPTIKYNGQGSPAMLLQCTISKKKEEVDWTKWRVNVGDPSVFYEYKSDHDQKVIMKLEHQILNHWRVIEFQKEVPWDSKRRALKMRLPDCWTGREYSLQRLEVHSHVLLKDQNEPTFSEGILQKKVGDTWSVAIPDSPSKGWNHVTIAESALTPLEDVVFENWWFTLIDKGIHVYPPHDIAKVLQEVNQTLEWADVHNKLDNLRDVYIPTMMRFLQYNAGDSSQKARFEINHHEVTRAIQAVIDARDA